jgi:hypothetical protein
MKTDLGIKKDECCLATDSPSNGKKESKIVYPCLRIDVSEKNKDLLSSIAGSGDATISFRVKSIRIGEDYFDKDTAGCIELEVVSIDTKGGKPMLNMNSSQSLDSYMKNKKSKEDYEEDEE